jgi:RNA polymerase sigma-70 factor (ECF subfamily)
MIPQDARSKGGKPLPAPTYKAGENRTILETFPQPAAAAPGHKQSDADSLLVSAVLRKDRKATAEFVARYSDSVYRYVRARLSPRMDLVEDTVQETFLAAWEHLSSYRGTSSLQSWLLGIARHKVEDHYRSVLRQPDLLSDLRDDDLSEDGDLAIESTMDRKRLQEKIRRVLAELPRPYSVALLWRYWEHRSAREMAEQTGRTEKAIERLLARARSQFREKWEHE